MPPNRIATEEITCSIVAKHSPTEHISNLLGTKRSRLRASSSDAAALAFGHLAPDVGLFALNTSLRAVRPSFDALQSLPFPLGSGAPAFVGTRLSLVRSLFAVIRDSVPFVRDPVSLVCEPFAPFELGFTSCERLLGTKFLCNGVIRRACDPGYTDDSRRGVSRTAPQRSCAHIILGLHT